MDSGGSAMGCGAAARGGGVRRGRAGRSVPNLARGGPVAVSADRGGGEAGSVTWRPPIGYSRRRVAVLASRLATSGGGAGGWHRN